MSLQSLLAEEKQLTAQYEDVIFDAGILELLANEKRELIDAGTASDEDLYLFQLFGDAHLDRAEEAREVANKANDISLRRALMEEGISSRQIRKIKPRPRVAW